MILENGDDGSFDDSLKRALACICEENGVLEAALGLTFSVVVSAFSYVGSNVKSRFTQDEMCRALGSVRNRVSVKECRTCEGGGHELGFA